MVIDSKIGIKIVLYQLSLYIMFLRVKSVCISITLDGIHWHSLPPAQAVCTELFALYTNFEELAFFALANILI